MHQHHELNVTGHPTPNQQVDPARAELVAKRLLVAAPVFVGQEDVLAIVAAMRDPVRYIHRHQPRLPGHQALQQRTTHCSILETGRCRPLFRNRRSKELLGENYRALIQLVWSITVPDGMPGIFMAVLKLLEALTLLYALGFPSALLRIVAEKSSQGIVAARANSTIAVPRFPSRCRVIIFNSFLFDE